MEKALVTYFDIKKSGFYKYKRGAQPDLIEGSYPDIIESIFNWIQNEDDFINCIPWSTEAHKNRPEIYTRSSHFDANTGDYIFVFWKKTTNKSGRLGGIAEDAKNKETNGDAFSLNASKKNGKTLIVGQPMYYWFIPEFNILATIKFSDSLIETQSICSYMKRAIDNKVQHPCKKTTHSTSHHPTSGNDILVNRTRYQSTDGQHDNLTFNFEASEKRIDIYDADLDQLAKKITHVVVRDVISTKVMEDDRHPILKLFEKVLENKGNDIFNRHVEVETQISLTGDELRNLVELYSDSYDPINRWINIGFKEEGEESPRFFNSYLERTAIMAAPEEKHEDIHYTAEYLSKIIKRERNSLLASFYNDAIKVAQVEG
jgi:hypothetical protein